MIPAVERLGGTRVCEAIRGGATVCTATQRLARALRTAWDDLMQEEGRSAWRAPRILPYSTWLRQFVEDAIAFSGADLPFAPGAGRASVLLSTQQELLTWERALQEGGDAGAVLQPDMLAALLREAHEMELAWLIPEPDLQHLSGQGTAVYLRTREQARAFWRAQGQIPASLIPRIAIEVARRRPDLCPHSMVFAGFDLFSDAAFEVMQQALSDAGSRLLRPRSPSGALPDRIRRYADAQEEITAAALWARELLVQGERGIAVVVPGLDRIRPLVERRFSDVLSPATVMEGHDAETGLFELSLGVRCTAEPLISAALAALDLLRPRIPVASVSRVLRSPFFVQTGGHQRIRFDLRLRSAGVEEIGPAALGTMLERFSGEDDVLLAALAHLEPPGGRRSAREWAAFVQNALNALGWPGDRRLRSREFQATRRWDALLEEFAAYDAVLPPAGFSEASARLRRLTAERVFQPETHAAPVQIMGILETAGLRFAHCRVVGLTEEQWPPPARSNPFIPLSLQRRAGVTEALPDRYLEQMRGVLRRLAATSPDVVFSCSRQEGDRELLPSPLLEDTGMADADAAEDAVAAAASYARIIQQDFPAALARTEDHGGPRLAEGERPRGGARILTLQSACPFRAYAVVRLGADEPAAPEAGLRPLDRGNLLHETLHRFWRDVGSAEALRSLSASGLRSRLAAHLRDAERSLTDLRTRQLPVHVREAEHACALQVLEEWCEVERTRGAFTVKETEGSRDVRVGSLDLRLRIDRADVMPDGRLLLIDYKTGRHAPGEWLHERPREPQVPLYAVAAEAEVGALAYAVLRRGECGFAGIEDGAGDQAILEDAAEWLEQQGAEGLSWQDLLALWRERLDRLAEDFRAGRAAVDPRDGDETCATCGLQPLCRIDEQQRAEGRNV